MFTIKRSTKEAICTVMVVITAWAILIYAVLAFMDLQVMRTC